MTVTNAVVFWLFWSNFGKEKSVSGYDLCGLITNVPQRAAAAGVRLQRARAEVGHGRPLRSLAAIRVESEASRRGARLVRVRARARARALARTLTLT